MCDHCDKRKRDEADGKHESRSMGESLYEMVQQVGDIPPDIRAAIDAICEGAGLQIDSLPAAQRDPFTRLVAIMMVLIPDAGRAKQVPAREIHHAVNNTIRGAFQMAFVLGYTSESPDVPSQALPDASHVDWDAAWKRLQGGANT